MVIFRLEFYRCDHSVSDVSCCWRVLVINSIFCLFSITLVCLWSFCRNLLFFTLLFVFCVFSWVCFSSLCLYLWSQQYVFCLLLWKSMGLPRAASAGRQRNCRLRHFRVGLEISAEWSFFLHQDLHSLHSADTSIGILCLETSQTNRNRRPTQTERSRGLRGGRLGGLKLICAPRAAVGAPVLSAGGAIRCKHVCRLERTHTCHQHGVRKPETRVIPS